MPTDKRRRFGHGTLKRGQGMSRGGRTRTRTKAGCWSDRSASLAWMGKVPPAFRPPILNRRTICWLLAVGLYVDQNTTRLLATFVLLPISCSVVAQPFDAFC